MFPANLSLESRVPGAHRPGEAGSGISAHSVPPISDPHRSSHGRGDEVQRPACLRTQFCLVSAGQMTTAIVADPHEIANVCGITGIKYMLAASKNLPLKIYFG